MNQSLTLLLNGSIHQSVFLDGTIYFFANVAPLALLGVWGVYILLYKKEPGFFLYNIFTLSIAWAISWGLKLLFLNPRPFLALVEITPLFSLGGNDSFPSGHATVFAALTVITFSYNKPFGFYCLVLTILMGVARVAAGVHYPFDIIAGFVFGVIVALILRNILLKRQASELVKTDVK